MLNICKTKSLIREAVLHSMETKSLNRITAVDLAEEIGISRATLYRYYGSVNDIISEMEDEFFEGMRDCSRYYISAPLEFNRRETPYPGIVAVAKYMEENRRFFLAITGPNGDKNFVLRWHKLIREFYSGKLAYEGLSSENSDIYMELILAGSEAVVRYWFEQRSDLSAEEIAPIIQRLLYDPFARR